MQDKELYQQILGLESPWRVAGVHLDAEEKMEGWRNDYNEHRPAAWPDENSGFSHWLDQKNCSSSPSLILSPSLDPF